MHWCDLVISMGGWKGTCYDYDVTMLVMRLTVGTTILM